MMKYEIETVREEENAAMQRVQDGLGHSRGRRRSSSSFGGWWGRWELTGSLPQTDTTLSEECVCHEIVHVVVAVGHYAVLCCATMTTASWADSWSREKKTSCTKRQNIWHHPHVHHSPPSSSASIPIQTNIIFLNICASITLFLVISLD